MADDLPLQRQMSLIPYAIDREVVLRRGNAVVVFDPASRELSVRDEPEQALEITDCPYCHRPLRDDFSHKDEPGNDHRDSQHERSFVDPEYFAMLANSQRPSPNSSIPGTPTRRTHVPALRSGRSRNVSGNSRPPDPPTGAEFVGSAPAATSSQGISSSAFTPGYFKQFFREVRELGRGGNGVVLLVEHIMDTISLGYFACKRVPVGNDHTWLEKVLVEVKLLQGIPHKNLVAYHWVWLEDHQASKFAPSIPCLWILQEYCNAGDLHGYVTGPKPKSENTNERLKDRLRRKSRGEAPPPEDLTGPSKLTLDEIFSFFRDITSGLHHLHTKGYIHRDLKPSNCLLQKDGSRTRVLISDFGETQAAGATRRNTGATGTISYCAPEVLKQDANQGTFGNFTTKSDIFSLGMIVYFMCFGRLPYTSADGVDEEQEDLDELRAEILSWPGFGDEARLRTDLPEKLYRFLRRLLSVDPNERPSTEEILASIKGGAGINDSGTSILDDGPTRISILDEAARRPSAYTRSHSTFVGRPNLATKGRRHSQEHTRSISPLKYQAHMSNSSSKSRPTSPVDSSIMVRPRKIEIPPASTTPSQQQSPRLMLPPPPLPQTMSTRLNLLRHHYGTIVVIRTALFLVKMLLLFLPCSPYATNAWLLYPLLALATFELAIARFGVRLSIILFGIHLTLVATAYQHGRLCEGPKVLWHDM